MKIFHYTDINGFKGIITSKKLQLTSCKNMNDFTDRIYGHYYVAKSLICSNNCNVKKMINNLSTEDFLLENSIVQKVEYYSSSFCGRGNNDYLWENYAKKNEGFCIVFNKDYLKEQLQKKVNDNYRNIDGDNVHPESLSPFLNFLEVKYDDNICLFEERFNFYWRAFLPEVNCPNVKPYRNLLHTLLLDLSGFIKDKSFSQEEEHRLIFKDTYTGEAIKENEEIYSILNNFEYKKALDILGLNELINNEKKKRMLDLGSFFNENLIPEIIIGKDNVYKNNIGDLSLFLTRNSLNKTKILYN